MIQPPRSARPSLTVLAAAIAGIAIASLSIHVIMLQVLWVPYPDTSGIGRLGLLYPLAQSLGLVALAAAALPWLRRFHPVVRGLIVAALFGTMNGIVRNTLMAGFATTDFRGSLGGFVHQVLLDIIIAFIATGAVSYFRNFGIRIVVAVLMTVLTTLYLNSALGSLLAPLMAWSAQHAHADVYKVPYGANILVPSYLLFAETVTACVVARCIIHFRYASWDAKGGLRYVSLVLLIRGTWVMMFVWGPIIGMVSVSQFFLQDLAMASLSHLAWQHLILAKTERPDAQLQR